MAQITIDTDKIKEKVSSTAKAAAEGIKNFEAENRAEEEELYEEAEKRYGKKTAKFLRGYDKFSKIRLTVVGIIILVMIVSAIFKFAFNSEQKYIEGVKQSYLSTYSTTTTVEDAFSYRFENEKWTYEEVGDTPYVVFTGYDPANGLNWVVEFKCGDFNDDGTFGYEVSHVSLNGVDDGVDIDSSMPLDLAYTINYVYTGQY